MKADRSVFCVSDSTGITAEMLARTLLSQFEDAAGEPVVLPYVNTPERVEETLRRIDEAGRGDAPPPLVFSTLVDPALRARLGAARAVHLDVFGALIGRLEEALGTSASPRMGRSHGVSNPEHYGRRMDAVNFALATDDGVGTHNYDAADVIVVGMSRSGKTPTCLYLALQHGVRAANYPLTPEDLDDLRIPSALERYRARLFGLTTTAERLHAIRSQRRPDSRYAAMGQCQYEVRQVEALYRRYGIAYLNTATMSVEEIATAIVHRKGPSGDDHAGG